MLCTTRPSAIHTLLVYGTVLALVVPFATIAGAAEQRIDLDGNPLNGKESVVETKVLQSFPVEIENVITNNALGSAFLFTWPGAGPGGFDSLVTKGPDVGTKWSWSTVSQVYSVNSPVSFVRDARQLPVFGAPPGGIQGSTETQVFDVPGKSIFPTQVTLSSASLTASLVTFFSPENTIATCESRFEPGRFEQTLRNESGETVVFMVEEPDCCPQPQMTICEDDCKFYLTDDLNCGGCGIECAFDEFCGQGVCEPICPGVGQALCDDECVDTLNDDTNCGGCGVTCEFDEFCGAGSCEPICPGVGQELCGEVCVDTLNDVANCGGCGIICAFDEFCGEGSCEPICPGAGQELCGEVCVDTFTDDANCGGCGITCAFDEVCGGGTCGPICPGEGQAYCDGVCADTLNDDANCGGCGFTCEFDEFCDGGNCGPVCPGEGQELCGEVCVDTLNDTANCGGCGVSCAFDEFCGGGTCEPICPGEGQELCGETCVDTLTDLGNCGGCGITCAFDEFCGAGTCEPICPGQTYCDGQCVDLEDDPLNCGACGNVCGSNDICTESSCFTCRPPLKDACDNECVNIHKDPYNCGGCGNVCDFSNCPSTGTGACSQGESCICDESPESSEPAMVFLPTPATALVAAVSAPTRLPGYERPAATRAGRATQKTGAGVGVIEAPVCGVPVIEEEIADGESFTLCQTGAIVGEEIFTTATVMRADGSTAGQGPCALIVPSMASTVNEFHPSPVSVVLKDASGDGLAQPGETIQAFVEILNLGPEELVNPVVVLSSPTDSFNPLSIQFLQNTKNYQDFPGLTETSDCSTQQVLTPRTNATPFEFVIPEDQEPDIGRVFNVHIEGSIGVPYSAEMSLVIGIGGACDPEATPDATRYDGIEGFLTPVEAALVPKGQPLNHSDGNFNQGSNVPFKLRLKCGSATLGPEAFDLRPQIVRLEHETLGELPLSNINADNNANPNDPFFDCSTNRCEYGLRTEQLPVGDYVIDIRMPDSRVFQAGFTVRP